jgi:Protein of unknown function (DUF2950)
MENLTMKTASILLFGAVLSLPGASLAAEAQRFETPEDAVEALVTAVRARSVESALAVFGDGAEDLLLTGERAADREAWDTFLERFDEKAVVETVYDDTAILIIGDDDWAFPAPLAMGEDGLWAFDAEAARDEVLARRIGNNELDVIGLLRGYVEAQAEYRSADWDGDGVMEFASSIISSEGQRDGLFWPDDDSPIGDFVAKAVASGYSIDGEDQDPEPFSGYYFQMLSGQGEAAQGGAFDYVINGNQVAGHAVLAIPAEYGITGTMTFMVNENGVVMEADLGPETLERALAMTLYDPGEEWVAAED